MFGGGGITSSWSNQNQQQQPQSTGSAFGQPSFGQSAFGGSGSAFGQNQQQQQQQPQVNPMFGNIATPSTSTTSGFGAFGGSSGTTGTSAFGATKPASGFGAFSGGTGTFGSGGAFGQNASASTSTPSAFGQSSTGASAFGSGTGLFGQNKTTGAFGSSTTTSPDAPVPPVTTGTANPPWSATSDKDQNGTSLCNYQTISAMPAYKGTSLEELRCQDYAQGRKTASTGGAFGQSAFAGNQASQPAGSGLFGSQQPNQQTSAFGTTPNAGGSAFGTFGQNQANQGTTSAFGGGGAFGQAQQTQTQQPAQQQSAFGAFGQQQTGGGAFGTTNAFNKPASAFGSFANPSGTGAFGSGGAFGQNNAANNQQQQQQQQQQQSSVFGPPSTNTGLGAFAAANTNKSVFGQTSQPAGQTPNAFGGGGTNIFGQANQAQQTQPQPSSLFGTGTFGSTNNQQQQQQQQQPNPLFGSSATQGSGGLFTTGSSLFGNNQQQQQQQQNQAGQNALGLFGSKPAGQTQPLFGTGFGQQQQQPTNTAQSNIFGSNPNQQGTQQNAFGSSLFGNKPLGASMSNGQPTGLFGNSGNTFNASASVPGAQGTLTASIAQPIATNLPIFSMLPPGPQAVSLDQSTKKKVSFFVDVPTRSPVPRMQLGFSPASSKLRGFASTGSVSSASGLNFSQGAPLALSLSKSADIKPSDSLLGRSASPSLGSGQKRSVKKLIFDKKVSPADLYVKSPSNSPGRGRVTFSPALSIAQREKEAEERSQSANQFMPSSSPGPRSHNPKNTQAADGADVDSSNTLDEGEYWVKPSMETLKGCGYDQISSFEDLVVGREGYGEIRFLEPVDLTGLPKLGSLLGDVIRFDEKECSVYPDSEDVDKPPPGSGLNVRARISLKRCWAVDKANRDPIVDETHPQAIKHLKRLKNMKDTHFESFNVKDGTWTFTVDHF